MSSASYDDPLRLSHGRSRAAGTSPSGASREGEAVQGNASVRDRLRKVTAQIHEGLHHAEPFAHIADGTMDLAAYGGLLQFLYRYHAGMAPLCDAAARALEGPSLSVAHQTRLMALEADLMHFSLHHSAGGIGPEPFPRRGAAFAVGCLYTVQGSTLGGKVIWRQLDALLPDAKGRQFFKGQPGDGALWQLLVAGLEKFAKPSHLPDLEDGAHYAFARFERMLEE